MAAKATFTVEGLAELDEVLRQIESDFGPKDTNQILTKALRKAMVPALQTARALVPVDTSALQHSLQIEARKPTSRDRRSKYVSQGDVAIASVTTAPGFKLARTAYLNQRTKRKATNKTMKTIGVKSDARATAVEFGTSKMAARPFLRAALEGSGEYVLRILGGELDNQLKRYKARQARRAAKLAKAT